MHIPKNKTFVISYLLRTILKNKTPKTYEIDEEVLTTVVINDGVKFYTFVLYFVSNSSKVGIYIPYRSM